MVNVSDALKTIFKNDMFPLSPTIADKDIEAVFQSISLTVGTDQFAVDKGDLEISESICTDGDLKFGKCNSSSVKFTVADVSDDIKGREFSLNQTVNSGGASYPVPLGIFKVDSANKQGDLRFKDIVAYDRMRKVDIDVTPWYNSLFPIGTETYTLAQFRASFLAHTGITEDTSKLPLPNDSMTVTKTIEPASLSGRMVVEAIEEINGVFGHINRSGQFTHIILKPAYGDYPTNDYPTNDYPISEDDTSFVTAGYVDETITESMRQGVHFEEYTVKEIDKLIIRTDDEDIGSIVGTGTNAYIIQGNFLVFGKGAAELATIARNAFGYMAKRPYRPYESESIGLPYLEPGDMIKHDQMEPVIGYIFSRTLKGIQSLRDEYSASGSQELPQNTSRNVEIEVLKRKATTIKKDVDGVRVEVSDLAAETSTQFEQTANSIGLKVAKADIIQSINLSTEGLKIDVTKLDITGLVTITSLNTPGSVVIDGGNLKAGTVVADTVRAGWVYANDISANQISAGGTISGVTFTTTGAYGTVTLTDGNMVADSASIDNLVIPTQLVIGSIQMFAYDGSASFQKITCYNVNGGTPVTSVNISSQAVGYANSSGSVSSISGHYTSEITASDTGYGNIDLQGFDNAAGVNYVQANYQPISPSDIRLKHNILPLDNILDELFYSLKPYQFKYKTDTYGDGVFFGLIAQQLENAFLSYGLNPYDYDLIEVKDVKKYTDDGYYVNDKTHRIHYNNFIAWLIKMVQKQNERIVHLENIIK
jgi:hypothetical protein